MITTNMSESGGDLAGEARRRRTMAIISHPDAGKTTLTEKLLLYGGAIRLAGAVKSRKSQRHVTSDWMELERQRGISVTSSVLAFPYNGYQVNILDTPGHQDFSEDTYRTLTAADSAVMLIDAAKGVEAQTKKLFAVCRMRGIPIFTFINKMDRYGREPLDLLDELEQVLGIRSCPLNWPMGMGSEFRGVYDRQRQQVELFEPGGSHGERMVGARFAGPDDPALAGLVGHDLHRRLIEEVALLDIAGDPFDLERVRRGELTPVFFGSALTNFGVRAFLEDFLTLAPGPAPRTTAGGGSVLPEDERFSGFVFKIQANMNPAHRDRIAFVRIVSGKFERGMTVRHIRTGKDVRLSQPQQFLAQERTVVDEAWPGDIVGLFDPGIFRIGDTLCTGEPIEFGGIPQFSPEHFAVVRPKETSKQKQFKKGLDQLSEEGAVQVFQAWGGSSVHPVLGVVGELQFDVLAHRMESEYGVPLVIERLPFELARWADGEGFDPARYQRGLGTMVVEDRDGRPVVLFETEWTLRRAQDQSPRLQFLAVPPAFAS